MLSLYQWCRVLKAVIDNDAVLKNLGVQSAYYQIAPSGTEGEFVTHQMQNGVFDRTFGGIADYDFSWQICALAGDRQGESPMFRADAIATRLLEMFEGGEELVSEALQELGFQCEVSRVTGYVVPTMQMLGSAQKWRYGHKFQFILQPVG